MAGSLLAGAGWSWNYGLRGSALALTLCVHLSLGIGLGITAAIARAWVTPRAASGLLAALLLAGLVPALGLCTAPPLSSDLLPLRKLAAVEQRDASARRLAVIGLDGGDWSVIDPLIAAGELPNLAGLLSRGRSAVLLSSEPTVSPVVWTSIFSGRRPEQHGIDGWYTAHSANRRTGLLWEMAEAAGLTSVVINVPGTWPPSELRGALVSGFPLPGALLHPGQDPRLAQNLGIVVSARERPGPLHTTLAEPDEDGVLRAQPSLGGWLARMRSPLRHFAIDRALRRGWLPARAVRIALAMPAPGDRGRERWTVDGEPIELARGAWSRWLEARAPIGPLHLRIRRLADDALFVTPAFQDPRAPIHPYTSSREVSDVVADLGMYVVEPTGWKIVGDPGARDALFEHLVDVEEMHLRASLALRRWLPEWRVFVHVVTLPDRASHAFWRFHRPEDYPPVRADELAAHRGKVALAYRESDRLLGRLLEGLGSDTAVIVISDHGFASEGNSYGEHRIEGMFVAAGPGIAPGAERLELSIYDVTPLALSLLGLPTAADFAGDVPAALVAPGVPIRSIASYEVGSGTTDQPRAPTTIDETTQEQLRGLGYIQ